MKIPILNAEGKEVGTREILAGWAQRPVVPALLHQAVVAASANARIRRAHTKNRGEVRGGGRKPWRQKGTGRARHGSIRSPLWKGGGVTFGPRRDQTFAKRLPAAMKRTALAMAILTKARDAELTMVEAFPEATKTKELAAFVQRLGRKGSLLFLAPDDRQATLVRASRNLRKTRVARAAALTAADVLRARHLVVAPESWAALERRLERPAPKASEARPETP